MEEGGGMPAGEACADRFSGKMKERVVIRVPKWCILFVRADNSQYFFIANKTVCPKSFCIFENEY